MIACDNKKQEIGGVFIMHFKFKVVLLVKRIAQYTCSTNALCKYVGINNYNYMKNNFFQKHLGMYSKKNGNIYKAYFKPQIGYIYQN